MAENKEYNVLEELANAFHQRAHDIGELNNQKNELKANQDKVASNEREVAAAQAKVDRWNNTIRKLAKEL